MEKTKIDIISGFLGAGKTTLIKKLLKDAFQGEQVVLIENEFGEIGIDGGFLKEAGIQIREMNSGCICCSLVGDFGASLKEVISKYHPDRILIEPSGVGKLSDVIKAVQGVEEETGLVLNSYTTVVDAKKCKMYMRNFGEFFNNQITYASCLILSHTAGLSTEKIDDCIRRIKELNPVAPIVTTEWDQLSSQQLVDAMTQKNTLDDELKALLEEEKGHHHHEDEHEHCCHHDHEEDEHDHCCHHDHDEDEHEHCHHHDHEEHEHEHGPDCTCGCHDHHHHHHADDVFTSWGIETPAAYSAEEITNALNALGNEEAYGMILRAKGIVAGKDGQWIHFDYVPGVPDVRTGSAGTIGRLCVIGSKINEEAIAKLFGTENN